jgi:hypothetical protein
MSDDTVWLFTYRDALGKEKYMAIFEETRAEAEKKYNATREATDRLVGSTRLTSKQYRDWKKSL